LAYEKSLRHYRDTLKNYLLPSIAGRGRGWVFYTLLPPILTDRWQHSILNNLIHCLLTVAAVFTDGCHPYSQFNIKLKKQIQLILFGRKARSRTSVYPPLCTACVNYISRHPSAIIHLHLGHLVC